MRQVFLGAVLAVSAFGQQKNFLACPIVRDTKTVPCYLAEYDGETYFLGIQQDITAAFHPPQLKHQVLVEGTVAPGPRVCGGIPLQPLTISVIKEVNLACDTLLPAEPGIEAPPAARGAGPAPGRLETRPARTREAIIGPHEFAAMFSFDDDYVDIRAQGVVSEAAEYARKNPGAKVQVAGYRAATLLSTGDKMTEKSGIAGKRAQNVATLLRGLGVSNVEVTSKADPEPGDGKTDPAHRRVTIAVTPR